VVGPDARESRVEVVGGSPRERGQLAKVGAPGCSDAVEELRRGRFAVDTAQKFVADRLREMVGRIRPFGERSRRCRTGCDLDKRTATRERGRGLFPRTR
jgi:hypothetical protein